MNTAELSQILRVIYSEEDNDDPDLTSEIKDKHVEFLQERTKFEMEQFDDPDYKDMFSYVEHVDHDKVIIMYNDKCYLIHRDIDFNLNPPSIIELKNGSEDEDTDILNTPSLSDWSPVLTSVKWFLMTMIVKQD